jgi:hypothetical protein
MVPRVLRDVFVTAVDALFPPQAPEATAGPVDGSNGFEEVFRT